MRTSLFPCLVLVSWLSSSATADEPAPAGPEARFQSLLDEAKAHPEKADWKALRLAFSKTPAYRPYSTDGLDTAPVEQELKNGESTAALLALDRILEGHWVDPSAHDYAARVCEQAGEPARARLHETFMHGLVDAIYERGKGLALSEPLTVLTIGEEYLILDALDLRHGEQKLLEQSGHFYDVHTFKNPQTGREITIYFNVDLPRQWLREHGPRL